VIRAADAHGQIQAYWNRKQDEKARPIEVNRDSMTTKELYGRRGKNITAEDLAFEEVWDTLERRGGPCIKCNKAWRPIEVDNAVARFDYHQPNCACFPRCPYCEHYLYQECARELAVCLTCGPMEGQPGAVQIGQCYRTVSKDVPDGSGKMGRTKTIDAACLGALRLRQDGRLKCDACGHYTHKIAVDKVVQTGGLPMKVVEVEKRFGLSGEELQATTGQEGWQDEEVT